MLFCNDTASAESSTLSLHDALPISALCSSIGRHWGSKCSGMRQRCGSAKSCTILLAMPSACCRRPSSPVASARSEEHTSELQSRQYLVCCLLLEKNKTVPQTQNPNW